MDDTLYQKLAGRSRNLSEQGLEVSAEQRRLLEAAIGMAGELSEITEPIKKHIFHGKPLDHAQLIDEMGDLLWYLDELCQVLGVTLEDVKRGNVQKLKERYKLED